MTTQETALVRVPSYDDKQRELIKHTVAKGTTAEEFELFIQVCLATGLNPFARQIYAVMRSDHGVNKMTIQTGIDGYRLLAQRSGEYAGQEGPFWYDAESQEWVDVWIKDSPPAAAKVGVMRRGFIKPIYAVARFESYASRSYNQQTGKFNGPLMTLWAKMPELMIAKVAEALALRRAFPAELSGIYTKEEMMQTDATDYVDAEAIETHQEAPTPSTNGATPSTPSQNGKAMPASSGQAEGAKKPFRKEVVEVYRLGKDKKYWQSTTEFYAALSATTGNAINEQNVNDVSDETLADLLAQPAGK